LPELPERVLVPVRVRLRSAPAFSKIGATLEPGDVMDRSFRVMAAAPFTSMRRPPVTVPVTSIFAPAFTVRTVPSKLQFVPVSPPTAVSMLNGSNAAAVRGTMLRISRAARVRARVLLSFFFML